MSLHRARVRGAVAVLAALAALPPLALPASAAAGLAGVDPLFSEQWSLQPGELDAPGAWAYADGAGVAVAVVDTGADLDHPDLRDALWTNPGEVAGNGVDDDGDGVVDDVHGADFVDHDGTPQDANGHGTHVAGIVAAQVDGEGTVGLAPGARIMVVRVLDANQRGTTQTVAQGIRYAVAHGARIINVSVNGDGDDPALEAALGAAGAAGATVVASAGNDARDLDLRPSWPAASRAPNVVSVAATDAQSLLAAFSNFGGRSVDLAAPGTDIVSTSSTGGYEQRSGTSMAAPAVSATLALLQSAAPGASSPELRAALLGSVRRPPGLLGDVLTGEVDPVAALRALGVPRTSSTAIVVEGRVKRRARKRRRTLVTWSLHGPAARVASFRVSGARGRTLALRRAASRGAWVRQRSGRVRITARDADGAAIAATTVRLSRRAARGR